MYCKNCGVELEDNMMDCPLCRTPFTRHGSNAGNKSPDAIKQKNFLQGSKPMNQQQKRFVWEIVSIILLSANIAAFSIDFLINKHITWSEYPVAISLIIFSYISLFTLWDVKISIRLIGCFILSSFFLISLDALTSGINWSIKLGIPLLLTGNLLAASLIVVIRTSRYKGINLIAYGFIAAAIQSIFVDGILSFFKTGSFHVEWSLIVVACVVPIVLVLLFVHFRLKKGRKLERLFHT